MPIPASVLTYINWLPANLSGATYTTVAPEKPASVTWTFAGSAAIYASSAPWPGGQELVDLNNSGSDAVERTISASDMQATSGRIMIEMEPATVDSVIPWRAEAATVGNGRFRVRRDGSGNLTVTLEYSGFGGLCDVQLGAFPTVAFAVEAIYDLGNATRSQRLRARTWSIGGSPGAFTDNSEPTSASGTTDQFVTTSFGDGGAPGLAIGRVAFSNDITEDLSNLDEGSGGFLAAWAGGANGVISNGARGA